MTVSVPAWPYEPAKSEQRYAYLQQPNQAFRRIRDKAKCAETDRHHGLALGKSNPGTSSGASESRVNASPFPSAGSPGGKRDSGAAERRIADECR